MMSSPEVVTLCSTSGTGTGTGEGLDPTMAFVDGHVV